jgi:cyclophilin family peptidyl-prolyl cis-trans isomerase
MKNTSEKLERYSLKEIALQSFIYILLAVVFVVFLFGNFQIGANGFTISSINCWVLPDDEKSARLDYANSLKNDDEYIKKLTEARDKFSEELKKVDVKNRTVTLNTNFGSIPIKLDSDKAPITAENFTLLTSKGFYNNTVFHRIVKQDNFNLIQGGDPTATGSGGESIFGFDFKDELKRTDTSCNAKFTEPVTYPKGTIAMANKGPATNGSQFFLVMSDIKLPLNYTIFGQVQEEGLKTLDKISAEVKVADSAGNITETGDGTPSTEIKISEAKLN